MKQIDKNYFKVDNSMQTNTVEDILDEDESVLLRQKPKRSAYIFNSIIRMLPIALLWLAFDSTFIVLAVMSTHGAGYIWAFLIPFFAVHLAPVWMWIAGIVKACAGYKNLEYVFTEKRIIVRSGVVGIDFKNIYYSDIEAVNLRVGLVDRMFKVGDIYITAKHQAEVLFDIPNPYFILSKVQKIVIDIKTDINFPNDLRPETNSGFKTKYRPKD